LHQGARAGPWREINRPELIPALCESLPAKINFRGLKFVQENNNTIRWLSTQLRMCFTLGAQIGPE
jgi:hypothetical protein